MPKLTKKISSDFHKRVSPTASDGDVSLALCGENLREGDTHFKMLSSYDMVSLVTEEHLAINRTLGEKFAFSKRKVTL